MQIRLALGYHEVGQVEGNLGGVTTVEDSCSFLIDHEPEDRTLPPPCGEVSPIPSGNLGSEGSKTRCLPIFKRSEH